MSTNDDLEPNREKDCPQMNPQTILFNIADLRDPDDPQGRSYREVNAAKVHRYPIGALVEFNHGPRLWVVHHGRDCDQTPLYSLSFNPQLQQKED